MKSDRDYEAAIARSFEKGEWKPVKNLKKEIERYREAAVETLLKNRRVNIRISAMDLEGLQAKGPRNNNFTVLGAALTRLRGP